MSEPATTMDLLEESIREVEVLGEAMSSVCCIYSVDFGILEELRKTDV